MFQNKTIGTFFPGWFGSWMQMLLLRNVLGQKTLEPMAAVEEVHHEGLTDRFM